MDKLLSLINAPITNDIFQTSATIFATIIVLFFTLSIIPIQIHATEYSPTLLRYFRNKLFPKIIFLLLTLFFAYSVFFMIFPFNPISIFLCGVLLITSLILLGLLVFYVIKMLNPSDSLLPNIYKECKKYIKNNIIRNKKCKKLPNEKIAELKEVMEQVLYTSEKVDGNIDKFRINSNISRGLIKNMLPLKSLILSIIDKGDFDTFLNALNVLRDINIKYFSARKEYRSYYDDIMNFTHETLEDLIKATENNNNIYYIHEVLRIAQEIAISTIDVNVIGINQGSNYLTLNLCNLINNSTKINILTGRDDAAFEGARYLSNVGISLAKSGLIQTATNIFNFLTETTVISSKLGKEVIAYPARYGMAKIFYNALYDRKLFANYDYPYRRMIEGYDRVLSNIDKNHVNTAHNPIFEYNPDMLDDFSLSSLIRISLFSIKNDDTEVSYNIDVVSDIVNLMKKHHGRDYVISGSFNRQFYQISLWFIAFLDENIATELLIYQNEVNIPTANNKTSIKNILFDLLNYLSTLIPYNKELKIINSDIISNILSDLYLLIHLNKKHNLNLDAEIINAVSHFLDNLSKEKLSYTMIYNLEHFSTFLNKLGYTNFGHNLDKIFTSNRHDTMNINYHELLNHINRPIITFDNNFFAKLDSDIFGKPENSSRNQNLKLDKNNKPLPIPTSSE